jgi:hypothetical protein
MSLNVRASLGFVISLLLLGGSVAALRALTAAQPCPDRNAHAPSTVHRHLP